MATFKIFGKINRPETSESFAKSPKIGAMEFHFGKIALRNSVTFENETFHLVLLRYLEQLFCRRLVNSCAAVQCYKCMFEPSNNILNQCQNRLSKMII